MYKSDLLRNMGKRDQTIFNLQTTTNNRLERRLRSSPAGLSPISTSWTTWWKNMVKIMMTMIKYDYLPIPTYFLHNITDNVQEPKVHDDIPAGLHILNHVYR